MHLKGGVPMGQDASQSPSDPPQVAELMAGQPQRTAVILAISLAGWACLAWIALDMSHPLVQLTMPGTSSWSPASAVAIFLMWAIMMAAMMLPSALPMILTFVHLSALGEQPARARAFVGAYLLIWMLFSAAATVAQWALQAMDWVDPMIVSSSARLTGLLLVIAGVYQFSPLKGICLAHCRTPFGFVLGHWKAGVDGAFWMGVRHGLACLGCCWALMALLFVGGVMNLAWIAALSIVVAVEKMAAGGERLARVLGLALIAAGLVKWAALTASGS
jgi:predicted metal-binding membrane protein